MSVIFNDINEKIIQIKLLEYIRKHKPQKFIELQQDEIGIMKQNINILNNDVAELTKFAKTTHKILFKLLDVLGSQRK